MQEEVNVQEQKEKRKKRLLLLLLLLLFLVAAVGGGLWWKMKMSQPAQVVSGLPNTKRTEKMSDAELKKYADKVVDESNVTIQVFPTVTIKEDGKNGTMWVQNPPTNATGQQAKLVETETGDVLFDSGLIKPGFQVSSVKLDKTLGKGQHKGTMDIYFYDLKEKKQVGQTKVDVTINVQ